MVCFIKSILTEEMRKLFTKLVPQKVLNELRWSNPATYADVFDFFADKGMLISVSKTYSLEEESFVEGYDWYVDFENTRRGGFAGDSCTWEGAALDAIIACLIVMKENYGKRNNQS